MVSVLQSDSTIAHRFQVSGLACGPVVLFRDITLEFEWRMLMVHTDVLESRITATDIVDGKGWGSCVVRSSVDSGPIEHMIQHEPVLMWWND